MASYAVSDLHGYYDLYEQINNFIKPEDRVYFLGDACDRGPDGYKLMKAILSNSQWKYLSGNHEDMFCKSARSAKQDLEERGYIDYSWGPVWQHYRNGGQVTLEAWIEDGMPMDIIEELEKLDYTRVYITSNNTKIYLNHSGYMAPYFFKISKKSAIWDRDQIAYDHWYEKWPEGYCIHGHSVIQYLNDYLFPYGDGPASARLSKDIEPKWYCENRKCDIDMGTVLSGQTCLLNLDTFEYHIFTSSQPPLY